MRVTPAEPGDLPELVALLLQLFTQEAEFVPDASLQEAGLRELLGSPDVGRILVLRDGDEILGMANVLFTFSTALGGRAAILEDVIVRPDRRGEGRGSDLLQAALRLAKAEGCRRITLLTDRDNDGAQRLYVRHGFEMSPMCVMRRPLD